MLVSPIIDYYKKTGSFKPDSAIDYSVGTIKAIGSDLPKEIIGKVIYYHRNIATKIDLKKFGKFDLVTESLKLLIRMDETETNIN